jgi:hypothetical protein
MRSKIGPPSTQRLDRVLRIDPSPQQIEPRRC